MVERRDGSGGRGTYHLTPAGQEFVPVVMALGVWGQRWSRRELAVHEVDLGLLLWALERGAHPEAFGDGRAVIELLFPEQPEQKRRWWFLNEHGRAELCLAPPGGEVVLYLQVSLRDMIRISDARMSGTAYGTVVLHVAPEAAVGGGLALIKSGDLVRVDLAKGTANILISGDGEVKLSDFGIAQTSQVEELGLRLRGKVGYMSPEQARQEELDQRSDLFSLGTVLYELLTAKRLFVGQEGESASRVYAAPILPPSALCPSLPPSADAVILRALQLDKNDRPHSALKWYEELLLLSQRHGLWMDRSELGAHLRVMLGDDPESWRLVEERSGTARIPSFLEADELWEEPSGSVPSE